MLGHQFVNGGFLVVEFSWLVSLESLLALGAVGS